LYTELLNLNVLASDLGGHKCPENNVKNVPFSISTHFSDF